MANFFNTRIRLRYDTYTAWKNTNPVLLEGEVAIAVPGTEFGNEGQKTSTAPCLMKVGNGTAHFNDLPWLSALAADVHTWAKKSESEFKAWLTSTEGPALATASEVAAVADRVTILEDKVKDLEETTIPGLDERVEALETKGANKVEASTNNGSIKIDGVETVVYTHPETHSMEEIDGLQDALDAKLDSADFEGHGHVIGDVDGLQDALDAKADNEFLNSEFDKLKMFLTSGEEFDGWRGDWDFGSAADLTMAVSHHTGQIRDIETLLGDDTRMLGTVTQAIADLQDEMTTHTHLPEDISYSTNYDDQVTNVKEALDDLYSDLDLETAERKIYADYIARLGWPHPDHQHDYGSQELFNRIENDGEATNMYDLLQSDLAQKANVSDVNDISARLDENGDIDLAIKAAKQVGENASAAVNALAGEGNTSTVKANADAIAKLKEDIGNVANVMNFRGVSVKGETTTPGHDITDPKSGDVIIYGEAEYVYNGSAWIKFGDASDNATAIANLQERVGNIETELGENGDITKAIAAAQKAADDAQADADEANRLIGIINGSGDGSITKAVADAVATAAADATTKANKAKEDAIADANTKFETVNNNITELKNFDKTAITGHVTPSTVEGQPDSIAFKLDGTALELIFVCGGAAI